MKNKHLLCSVFVTLVLETASLFYPAFSLAANLTTAKDTLQSSRMSFYGRIAVSSPVNEKASITKFASPKFIEQGPVDFTGTIESLSDIHINPKGTITISDPLNSKVAEVKVDAGNIFPETSRDFTAVWNQKWGWGRYKAELNFAYGAAGTLTATIFFWLFPIRLVIYALIALIAVLIIIIALNDRSKKHQQELEKEVKELKEELQNIESK